MKQARYSEITINGLPLPTRLPPREVPRPEFCATMRMDPESWQALQAAMEPLAVARRLEAARLYAFECAEEARRSMGMCVVQRDPRSLLRALFVLGLARFEPAKQVNASKALAVEPADDLG